MTLPDLRRWKQLSAGLDELFELDADARRHYLLELRRHDSPLASELEAMLSAADHAEASGFLSGRLPGHDTCASLVGERIGAYIVQAPIGQGGSGSVWGARRADGRFEGMVAIKLLHLSLVGRLGAQRFEREGAILARLAHPHIARLLDAGVTPSGQPYLVIELVVGERIDRYCDARRLSIEQRLALFDDVLAAVAHAHNHLVIHRDIKPTNILVGHDGAVKLLDFGIAKLLENDREESSTTAEGQRALTPEYAAPEQLRGTGVTTATDVYALGVLLYVLLTGRHPHAHHAASPAEAMRATLETDPPRLTEALSAHCSEERGTTLARLRRQLQGDLENIVACALHKDPAQRYQTVNALADDLRRYRASEPVSARPDSLAYRSAKFMRRHRTGVAAGLLILLATSAGLVGTITQARRAEHERDNALHQLANAESSNEFIGFLLQEGSDKPFTTAELLDRGEQLVARQFADDPAQRARLRLMLAEQYGQAMSQKKALAVLRAAQADAHGGADLPLQITIDCQIAAQLGDNGAFDQALPMIDHALEQLRASPEIDRALLARCLHARAAMSIERGDMKAAAADAQAALDTLGSPRADQRTRAVLMRATLASAQGKLLQSAHAETEMRRAIAELEAMGRGRTELAGTLYNDLGVLLFDAGQTLRATEAYERARKIIHDLRGDDPVLEGNYASLLIQLERPREALPLVERALDAASAMADKGVAPWVALQGAPAWCQTHDLARCDALLAMAKAGLARTRRAGDPIFGTIELRLAEAAMAHGAWAEARDGLQRASAMFGTRGANSLRGLRALTLLARVEQALGEGHAAQEHSARAVAGARESLAGFAHSEWLGRALVAQGLAQQAAGNAMAARASWREALDELQATAGPQAPATIEVRGLLAGS